MLCPVTRIGQFFYKYGRDIHSHTILQAQVYILRLLLHSGSNGYDAKLRRCIVPGGRAEEE